MSEFSDMETYVDSAGFGDNISLVNTSGMNSFLPREVLLHRADSARILNGLARGDSVKRFPQLDKFDSKAAGINNDNTGDGALQPITRYQKFQAWMINEGNRAIFFTVWIILHLLVFIMGFINFFFKDNLQNAREVFGITFPIARSAALVLHVDAGMILFPVCRNLISLIRSTPLNNVIPFDKNITFHKAIGYSILIFTIIHTVSHWVNFYKLTMANGGGIIMFLKLNFVTGPGITGYVMLFCLLIMVISSHEKARHSHFNRFWYLHHLFIPFFAAWSFHGAFCMIKPDRPPYCKDIASFWKYWIASGTIYISERILREIRARQKTYVSKVIMHPSKVVEIQIKKEHISTKAGQYIFLCCPEVSLWQWHPFTLTSAPEEDFISIHVRVVGDFTRALAEKLGCNFEEEEKIKKITAKNSKNHNTLANKPGYLSGVSGIDISPRNPEIQKVLPRVLIDGPFGSASEDVFKFEIAMLVGAGIGVTPFASILKSIWYRVNYPTKSTKLRKVYFFWICRDYGALEWFQSLLSAIEEQDIEQFIEIHAYLTGRLRHSEVRNVMVQDDGGERDAITGLRAPTHFGRPNWDKIFSNLRAKHPATDIGTFFCGPKALGKQLHNKCNLWTQGFEEGTRFFYGKAWTMELQPLGNIEILVTLKSGRETSTSTTWASITQIQLDVLLAYFSENV
ncbi:10071_t:CDS:2 [Ambispora gerdemannii]|uniref:10071_t:CDS:1 n=1 Tax=Ambispora gerdemannii TaxID=144530 RepID=A0A9N8Z9L3_9GLOM|nr:10071_t:CDS:2 [Ambispora gerdemannii]